MSKPDPLDLCECGDYRRDHKNGTGACRFNSNEFDLCHGGMDCHQFRKTLPEAPLQSGDAQ